MHVLYISDVSKEELLAKILKLEEENAGMEKFSLRKLALAIYRDFFQQKTNLKIASEKV